MHHESILAHYDGVIAELRARGEALRTELASLIGAELQLKVHSVSLRTKERASFEAKLKRPDKSYRDLWDVTDLVGLRVITYFEDEIDRVGQLVETQFSVNFEHSIDKRRRHSASDFGYRSLHYVCHFHPSENGILPEHACFEIQVRTVLDHAWAEVEHDLGYKARDVVPTSARRRLSRIAGLLELADQEFVAIRKELADYAKALPGRIASDEESIPLDRLSLTPLLECEEVCELDDDIARVLDKSLGSDPFYPDYLLKMLAASGITTVERARAGVRAHRDAIVSMVKPYFSFAWTTWQLSLDPMDFVLRGYSLFFLAHAEVIQSSTLGIDKVDRLAHLYRTVDYPDDARSAQRVASMLIEAFRDVPLPAMMTT